MTMKSQFLLGRARSLVARHQSTQPTGFTLIESLVAVIILTLTVVSVLPPIFWATATRVQNRRVEQAVQLAQSEIDRVRVAFERDARALDQLPPRTGAGLRPNAGPPTAVIAEAQKLRSNVPDCNRDDGAQSPNVGSVIAVDTDPEPAGQPCQAEYLIQTFRGAGLPDDTAASPPAGFVMGVRVYSIVARDNIQAGRAQVGQGKQGGTTGLGTQQLRPLTEQYSTIVRSNFSDTLNIYRQLCRSGGSAPGNNTACDGSAN
jgi:prepilin-type N-terminal cleavage/methylation domain-containing protein